MHKRDTLENMRSKVTWLIDKLHIANKKAHWPAVARDHMCSYSVRYFSQWESRDLNQKIELGSIMADMDPLWNRSGAIDRKEYRIWSWNICAIACLRMVSQNFRALPKDFRPIEFAKQAAKNGVYVYNVETEQIEGIFWKVFQEFLKNRFQIESRVMEFLPMYKIKQFLNQNYVVLLSVSPFIHRRRKHHQRSGHVVLVQGLREKQGEILGLFIKDPGGWIENNTQERFISTKELYQCYSGRGFVIKVPQSHHGK